MKELKLKVTAELDTEALKRDFENAFSNTKTPDSFKT